MVKKVKVGSSSKTYQWKPFHNSQAIQKQTPQPAPANTGPQNRVNIQQFLKPFHSHREALSLHRYPHHNRWLALAHSLCDQVVEKVKQMLQSTQQTMACGDGCDACCHYADVESTGVEFEEVVHYVKHQMPPSLRQELYQQIEEAPHFEQHGHRACPFLHRKRGHCTIYPVRPMGCRSLLATKRCALDSAEDTGLGTTVRMVAQAWETMPVRAGTLMSLQEFKRQGKQHANLKGLSPRYLVDFKQLEAESLKALFASEES